MSTKTIICTTEIKLEYDPNDPDFKNNLEAYREVIDSSGDKEDVLMHVAHNVLRFGHRTMVEGVGYVKAYGKYHDTPHSGITILNPDPDFDYEVE